MSRLILDMVGLIWAIAGLAQGQADEPSVSVTTHLVCRIDVGDFGAETLRIGDLDADGAPDLLFVQSVFGSRAITCLTATTIFGNLIWQEGTPSRDNGRIYSDLPVQIYDWDTDGRNEVLYVRQAVYVDPPYDGKSVRERASRYEGQARMVVLDGQTGKEKAAFDLPAPADDSFLFADLTGAGRRQDLVVKDRYWNMWGVAHQGQVLWHWEGATGHFPAIADVDGDGKDEVFVGLALIDHDGKVLFQKDAKGAHQDAAYIVRAPDSTWRLLFGNSGIHCLAVDGTELWSHPLGEAQHVVAGRFRADSAQLIQLTVEAGLALQFAVVDRTPEPHRRDENAWSILYMYDLDGKELWHDQQEKGAWAIAIVPVDWFGPGEPLGVMVYGHGKGRPAVIYNGAGKMVDVFPMVFTAAQNETDRQGDFYGLVADVWGDGRDEVILFGARGACIYANSRPLEIPTQYNETLYPGM